MRPTALLVLALASAAPSLGACHRTQASEPKGVERPPGEVWITTAQMTDAKLEVAPVGYHVIDDTLVTTGKLAFDDSQVSHVFSPIAGRVVRIDAKLGQKVKKGDLLAIIDSPDLGIASADVGKASADLIAAEHDYKRQKELYEAHAASQKDFEQAEDAYRKAKAELERARQKARLFRAGSTDSVTQGYALRAPIDGEVLARTLNPGAEVQGQYGGGTAVELFTIGDIDRVWLLADVYEMDIGLVRMGAPVDVEVAAYSGKLFRGTVDWISKMLDPSSRTAKMRCTFDNPGHVLKPDMYATVSIHVDGHSALAIPRAALLRLGDATVVFAERGEAPDERTRFERIPVAVDDRGGDWLPILHGLEAGQRIVTSGAILLSAMM